MDVKLESRSRCDACIWWSGTDDGRAGCPYRTAATRSNAAWRQILTGQCTHYLANPPDEEGEVVKHT